TRNSTRNMTISLPAQTLAGQVALVTGAGRGVGAGIALDLASRGALLVINYANSSSAAQSVVASIAKIPNQSTAIAIQADVSKTPEVTRLFKEAIAHYGRLNIVVSNSGMETFCAEEDVDEELYDKVFGLNTRAQFFVGQHALINLEPHGRIVLTSSVAATMSGVPNHALYAGSKAAVEGFCRSFSVDGGKKKITCNAIAPGGIKTDMYMQNSWHYAPGADPSWSIEKIDEGISRLCPLGRGGVPEDVAKVVSFLCSQDGEWINGQVIKLSGGSIA
ncbi:Hydroxynaphthalene reductase arp2, partial [Lachnellula suecica]